MIGEYQDGGLYLMSLIYAAGNLEHLVRTDGKGKIFPYNLYGFLRPSLPGGCEPLPDGSGLPEWRLTITPAGGGDTLYALTENSGYFETRLPAGDYEMNVIRRNAYRDVCPPMPFSVNDAVPNVLLYPTVSEVYGCELLSVGVSGPSRVSRCQTSLYRTEYRNQGTRAANESVLRLIIDPDYIIDGSFPNFTARRGDTLIYQLPPLAVGQTGEVLILGQLDCEGTPAELTHCLEARVLPDSLCTPPDVNWDGSSVKVSGKCETDSIFFKILNDSPNDMLGSRQYVVIEDLVLHLGGDFQLPAGDSLIISLPATGETYRLQAEQSPGHPGDSNPTVTIEGCGASDTDFSTGFFGQYEQDDHDPFVAITCAQNNGDLPGRSTETEPPVLLLTAYNVNIDTAVVTGDTLRGVMTTMATELTANGSTAAGCDSIVFYNVTLAIPDATDDFETEGFLLYPNPARDYAILRTPAGFRARDVRITDVLGRRYGVAATSGAGDGLLIDLRRLPAGTYALTAADRRAAVAGQAGGTSLGPAPFPTPFFIPGAGAAGAKEGAGRSV